MSKQETTVDNITNESQAKIVVVIGGSTGIGRATAVNLKKSGHNVIIGGKETSALIELQQIGIVTFSLDTNDKVSVERFIIQISKFVQKIDVLINAVDETTFLPFEMSTISSARNMFEENLFAPAELILKMIPMLERTGTDRLDQIPSKLIHITSISSRIALPLASWYTSVNHAIDGLLDGLRLELKKSRIQVINIQTGLLNENDVINKTEFRELNNQKYDNLMNKVMLKTKEIRKSGVSAETIARLAEKIIKNKSPRTKYIVGRQSKFIVVVQRIFGQTIAESLVRRLFLNFGK
jgi:short-subunit dehydrogenase